MDRMGQLFPRLPDRVIQTVTSQHKAEKKLYISTGAFSGRLSKDSFKLTRHERLAISCPFH